MEIEYNNDNSELYQVHEDKPKVKKRKRINRAAIYNKVSKKIEIDWNNAGLINRLFENNYKHLRNIYEIIYQ
jgi:hypothetical protein